MNTTALYPSPEAVDPRGHKPWAIEPSSGLSPRVFIQHAVLQVPLDDSDHSRFLRNHELGHIRWSHPKPDVTARRHKLAFDVLQAVEDMRINTKLSQTGLDMRCGAMPEAVATALAADVVRRQDVRGMILTMVAVQACGQTEDCFLETYRGHPLGEQAVRTAEMARRSLWANDNPKFRDTVRVATWLQLMLDNATPPPTIKCRPRRGEAAGEYDGLAQALKISGDLGVGRRLTKRIPWGRMNVETPPRPRRVAGYLGRRRIATEEGTLPRNMHRLLIDGRVFQRIRRGQGATVLIDCSGSMSLTPEDIKKILEHAPGACVAVYSGNVRDDVLRVLANEGREVESRWIGAPAGGANVIDGPALQWLSKQAKPRIWVCDGQVTGINDRMSAINSLECAALCHQRSIERCNNVAAGVTLLRGMRPR